MRARIFIKLTRTHKTWSMQTSGGAHGGPFHLLPSGSSLEAYISLSHALPHFSGSLGPGAWHNYHAGLSLSLSVRVCLCVFLDCLVLGDASDLISPLARELSSLLLLGFFPATLDKGLD